MKRDIQIIRDSIGRIVSMLTARKLKVTQRGTSAYVAYDTKTGDIQGVNLPYIPDDASDEFIAAIQGFLDHEVGHVLYTDRAAVLAAGKAGKRVMNMANILEDVFIEKKMAENFRGAGANLDVLRKFFYEKVCRSKMEDALREGNTELAQGFALAIAFRAWGGQPFAIDMIKDPKIAALIAPVEAKLGKALIAEVARCNSSAECLALAKKCVKALERTKPIAPPPPPPPPPAPAPEPAPEEEGSDAEPTDMEEEESERADTAGTPPEASEPSDAEIDPGDADATAPAPADAPEEEDDLAEDREEETSATPPPASSDSSDDDDGEPGPEPETERAESESLPEGESDLDDEVDGDGDDVLPEPVESSAETDEGSGEGGDSDAAGTESGRTGDDDGMAPDGTPDGMPDRSGGPETEPDDGGDRGPETEADDAPDSAGDDEDDRGSGTDEDDAITEEDMGGVMDEHKDFDEEVSSALTEAAKIEIRSADYRIFTSEFDVIEPGPQCSKADTVAAMVDEVTASVGVMQKHLERGMAAQNRKAWNPGLRRGRINPGSLFRTGVGDDRVFRQRTETRAKNTAVELLVDCSGSMGGHAIHTAGTAAFALCWTLERLKIKNEAIGFTTTHRGAGELHKAMLDEKSRGVEVSYSRGAEPLYLPIFKGFNERLDATTKSRFAALRESPRWLCQNIDGECVRIAANRLLQQTAERHVLLVLSDGSPCCSTASPRDLNPHLKGTVEQLERDGVEVIGIGLETDVVKNFYRKSLVLSDTSELATTLIGQLTKLLLED